MKKKIMEWSELWRTRAERIFALKMSLLSVVYTAWQALELGLVTEVVADEELMTRAADLAAHSTPVMWRLRQKVAEV